MGSRGCWLLIAVPLSMSACERDKGRRAGATPDAAPARAGVALECPPVEVLEALHAAVYWLEAGSEARQLQRELDVARKGLVAGAPSAAWTESYLKRIQEALEVDASRRLAAEHIRMDLHLSGCIPDEAHERFHQKLPAVR